MWATSTTAVRRTRGRRRKVYTPYGEAQGGSVKDEREKTEETKNSYMYSNKAETQADTKKHNFPNRNL